ncbi:MAG TPA: alkaline phosphatase [Chloroflexi bacterium]|nr:alkaline phosphatase [Chloroflexota bacterium]
MKICQPIAILLSLLVLSSCLAVPAQVAAPSPSPLATENLPTETGIIPQEPEASLTPPPEASPTTALTATDPPPTPTAEPAGPPGIILFIGDGMGAIHRQAATWLVSGKGGLLVMDNMPVHGLAQTASASNQVTDSAASATTMATGQLTYNGFVGVDPSNNPLSTILELAQVKGWSVGLVTTVQLAHATPAAFASHFPDRSNMPEIARQIMAHDIQVLMGGGEDHFFSTAEDGCFPGKGLQKAGNDLVAQAVEAGYTYVCTAEALQAIDPTQEDYLLGLFGGGEMKPPFNPPLSQMTQTAIQILSQDPDGFFLMVEAGQIDWAAHSNEARQTMQNTVSLDSAVAMAQIYALGNPNTLIIVTADHETGGMRLNQDGAGSYRQDGPFSMPSGESFWVDWSTTSHTADLIPVTAQGPYAEMLAGEYPLTQIFETMSTMLFMSVP